MPFCYEPHCRRSRYCNGCTDCKRHCACECFVEGCSRRSVCGKCVRCEHHCSCSGSPTRPCNAPLTLIVPSEIKMPSLHETGLSTLLESPDGFGPRLTLTRNGLFLEEPGIFRKNVHKLSDLGLSWTVSKMSKCGGSDITKDEVRLVAVMTDYILTGRLALQDHHGTEIPIAKDTSSPIATIVVDQPLLLITDRRQARLKGKFYSETGREIGKVLPPGKYGFVWGSGSVELHRREMYILDMLDSRGVTPWGRNDIVPSIMVTEVYRDLWGRGMSEMGDFFKKVHARAANGGEWCNFLVAEEDLDSPDWSAVAILESQLNIDSTQVGIDYGAFFIHELSPTFKSEEWKVFARSTIKAGHKNGQQLSGRDGGVWATPTMLEREMLRRFKTALRSGPLRERLQTGRV
ncbi:unnamed protein product [Chondrus crispus]|uniref:Uncharacterized protein n=1 Tax=Chondrus crispus TaxID=2769 RepID=R7QEQ8_CHOCR|nr:unnamed protein product [Chondrus crispus]CDF35910.1 unnamed protein product [Chondrus crispus]|eukprot:XP_005715729.1 unnamed protein product [Chondrus crispus]